MTPQEAECFARAIDAMSALIAEDNRAAMVALWKAMITLSSEEAQKVHDLIACSAYEDREFPSDSSA